MSISPSKRRVCVQPCRSEHCTSAVRKFDAAKPTARRAFVTAPTCDTFSLREKCGSNTASFVIKVLERERVWGGETSHKKYCGAPFCRKVGVLSLTRQTSDTFRKAESVAAPNTVRRCSSHKNGLNSVYLKYAPRILFPFNLEKKKKAVKVLEEGYGGVTSFKKSLPRQNSNHDHTGGGAVGRKIRCGGSGRKSGHGRNGNRNLLSCQKVPHTLPKGGFYPNRTH